jgi:TATA-binding protein-associated factor
VASYSEPSFPSFAVGELISQGKLLLASSGKEFQKPVGILSSVTEVKKARKEAMGRLGLDFLDTDDMDLDKEFAAEMEADQDVDMEQAQDPVPSEQKESVLEELSPPETPQVPSPTAPAPPSSAEADAALSARERNRLKRKRKAGNSAFVPAPPQVAGAKYSAMPTGTSNK